jgi:hypothetical protein
LVFFQKRTLLLGKKKQKLFVHLRRAKWGLGVGAVMA